jgi:hypothetical protein
LTLKKLLGLRLLLRLRSILKRGGSGKVRKQSTGNRFKTAINTEVNSKKRVFNKVKTIIKDNKQPSKGKKINNKLKMKKQH